MSDGLYEGADADVLGGGGLYEGVDLAVPVPRTLLYRDRVIVQPMRAERTPWGLDILPDGDPVYCLCSIEGRIQKSSTFSKNWAQDSVTGDQTGMLETTVMRMLAPEWHGGFYSVVWYQGCMYEVDGSPVEMPHSTRLARHWQVMLRRVVNGLFNPGVVEPTVPEGGVTWGMSG